MIREGPWFKCYPDTALGDLTGLPSDHRNVLFTMLLMMEAQGMPVQLRRKTLASACHLSTRRFNIVLAELIEGGKLVESEGYIGAGDVKHGRSFGQITAEKEQKNAGKNEGKSPIPTGFLKEINDPGADSRARGLEARSQKPEAAAAFARKGLVERATALHARICERLGNRGGYREDLGEVLSWLESGYDPDQHVMPAIERVLAREGAQLPTTLRYFREIVAEEATRRSRRPMPPPPERIITADNASDDEWSDYVARYAAMRRRYGKDEADWPHWARWGTKFLGPAPGQSGCLAPKEILERYGFAPDEDPSAEESAA